MMPIDFSRMVKEKSEETRSKKTSGAGIRTPDSFKGTSLNPHDRIPLRGTLLAYNNLHLLFEFEGILSHLLKYALLWSQTGHTP